MASSGWLGYGAMLLLAWAATFGGMILHLVYSNDIGKCDIASVVRSARGRHTGNNSKLRFVEAPLPLYSWNALVHPDPILLFHRAMSDTYYSSFVVTCSSLFGKCSGSHAALS